MGDSSWNIRTVLVFAGMWAYVGGAIWLAYFLARKVPTRSLKVLVAAAVLSVFFSLSLLVGHGVFPIPALIVVLWCSLGDCSGMYGANGLIYWGILPMIVQMVTIVVVTACGLALAQVVRRL